MSHYRHIVIHTHEKNTHKHRYTQQMHIQSYIERRKTERKTRQTI